MRSSVKRSLTGLLVVGALALGASGAYATGGAGSNSSDAFIGIVGGNPGYYLGGTYNYNNNPSNPGYEASDGYRSGHRSYGGNGGYDGGYRGY
jgi:hypothetical protein